MRQHATALLAAVALCLAAVAFVHADDAKPAAPAIVHMVDFAFKPASLAVHTGDTVVFQNDDQVTHDVSGDGLQSGDIDGGKSWKYTFTKAGTYTYVCTYHASMKGTITVTDASQ